MGRRPLWTVLPPHCACCEHFQLCLRTDMVIEWGYCDHESKGKVPPKDEIERIKREVESGDYHSLLSDAAGLGLFVPARTDCDAFTDFYPL